MKKRRTPYGARKRFVQDWIAGHPNATDGEVVRAAKNAGYTCSYSEVATMRQMAALAADLGGMDALMDALAELVEKMR